MIKTYGPYDRSDGRKHVIHYDNVTGMRRTQSYPRYIMEHHLGRVLLDDEEVDHINEDFGDDRIENLQILTKVENQKKSQKVTEYITFICPECGNEATKLARIVRHNRNQGKAGPYCSRQCAGKSF